MTTADAGLATCEASARFRLSICVFCGARSGSLNQVVDLSRELGAQLARRGHRLIYGGGGSGLMGEVAWAAHRGGGDVLGVMPELLYERARAEPSPPQTLHLTADLSTRKREMMLRADGFIALPGGYGTLDEVFEVLSLSYLGVQVKPLVLLDVDGVWRDLLGLVSGFQRRGYADECFDRLCTVVDDAATAVDLVERMALSAGSLPTARRHRE